MVKFGEIDTQFGKSVAVYGCEITIFIYLNRIHRLLDPKIATQQAVSVYIILSRYYSYKNMNKSKFTKPGRRYRYGRMVYSKRSVILNNFIEKP